MNATATTQPRRRGWGVMIALLVHPGRSRTAAREERRHERDRDLSAPQRDRLGAGLPFDGSDCE